MKSVHRVVLKPINLNNSQKVENISNWASNKHHEIAHLIKVMVFSLNWWRNTLTSNCIFSIRIESSLLLNGVVAVAVRSHFNVSNKWKIKTECQFHFAFEFIHFDELIGHMLFFQSLFLEFRLKRSNRFTMFVGIITTKKKRTE